MWVDDRTIYEMEIIIVFFKTFMTFRISTFDIKTQ